MDIVIFPILIYGIGMIAAVLNAVCSKDSHAAMGWGIAACLFGIILLKHLGF